MNLPGCSAKVLGLILIGLPLMAQQAFVATPMTQPAAVFPPATTNTWDSPREQVPAIRLYRWSVVSMLAANAADAATSWTNREANPFVAGTTTHFGVTSFAIKSGFVGASLLLQHLALRHNPQAAKRLAWMNFVSAGVLGGVAAHNASLR